MIIDHMQFISEVIKNDDISKEKKVKELKEVETLLIKSLNLVDKWNKQINEVTK